MINYIKNSTASFSVLALNIVVLCILFSNYYPELTIVHLLMLSIPGFKIAYELA